MTVQCACGWRGPYIQSPTFQQTGSSVQPRLLDGWGNPFDALTLLGTPVAVNDPVSVVRSRGADYQTTTAPYGIDPAPLPLPYQAYNQDQYAPAQSYQTNNNALILPSPLVSFATYGSVQVSVQAFNPYFNPATLGDPVASAQTATTDAVQIVLLSPVNGLLTPVYSTAVSLPTAQTPPQPTPVSWTFTNVPVGPRAIQAFQYDLTTMLVKKRSQVVYLMVPAAVFRLKP